MENHHLILHIPISLGSKFQLQQNNFDFLEQIAAKKNLSGQKSKKRKINVTIEYFILELV